MQPLADIRQAVYAAATECQANRVRVVLAGSAGAKRSIESAFTAWRAESGHDPAVCLTFTPEGQAVIQYVTDIEYD
jgi:hypothetical protein